jgi:hypothetical protein
MNNNAIRSILGVLTIAVALMTNVLGCSTDAAGVSVCSASWLPPQYAGIAIAAFGFLALAMKALRPGGFLAGLFGDTAVVTKTGGPGTVTAAQKASPSQ